ncbi:glycosyltransferase family 9 protein [Alteromonas sp. a30]|uniref:glycosyltransferase family 9 protein n=1 Tax=Alteromonas sp. a30 TaxID=2730917 RepID=UPI0022819949|nr:glycosyltransferase family 9 protein [Alteromonas sp. a30]
MNQNAKLCILRLSAIGDVCHAVALVNRIQTTRPDIQLTWVIGKVEYQLVKHLPNIRFVIFDKKQGKAAFKALEAALGNEQFDALFVMQVAFRANLVSRKINAKKRYGFDWHRSKELHWLFTNAHVSAHPQCHVLDGFMDFADAAGIPPLDPVTWNFPLPEKDESWVENQLSPHLNTGQKLAVINPAASKKERNWLSENYAKIADYLTEKGWLVVLSGGPAEMEITLAEEIEKQASQPLVNFVGKTSLPQLAALLKRCNLVIAPDTGPAHIAAMMGCQVVGLYAHSNPRRTGPYHNLHNVVSVYDDVIAQQKGKPWMQLPWGTRAKGKELMQKITLDAVKDKIDNIVNCD